MKVWVVPSEQIAERYLNKLLQESPHGVILGEPVLSLPHFLKAITRPSKPLLTRGLQRHWIRNLLKTVPLRYHQTLIHHPQLSQLFTSTLINLKKEGISLKKLRNILETAGTEKEYDLFQIYEAYEEEKEKKGWIDTEDLWNHPIENKFFDGITALSFEGFYKIPSPLQSKIEEIQKSRPIAIGISKKTKFLGNPKNSPSIEVFSLPSPYQEAQFITNRALTALGTINPNQISIVTPDRNSLGHLDSMLENLHLFPSPAKAIPLSENLEAIQMLHYFAKGPDNLSLPLIQWKWEAENFLKTFKSPFRKLLRQFDFVSQEFPEEKLTRREWYHLLQQDLSEETLNPSIPESATKIQTEDLNIAPLLPKSFLFIPHATENLYPGSPTYTPFFQDRRGLDKESSDILLPVFPTAQQIWEEKTALFFDSLTNAKNTVVITYPRVDSFGKETTPSLFLEKLPKLKDLGQQTPAIWKNLSKGEWENLNKKQEIEKERMLDQLSHSEHHAYLQPEILQDFLKEKIFSPSQLNTYASCPFRYFSDKLLEIPPQKEESPEIDPSDKGKLFHTIMERLLSQQAPLYESAKTDPEKFSKLLKEAEKLTNQVFEEYQIEYSYANRWLYENFKGRTLHWVQQLLHNEMAEGECVQSPLQTKYQEWIFGDKKESAWKIETPNEDPIFIGGRIDRIDIDGTNKKFLVLDYKTGSEIPNKEKMIAGLYLQIPIYVLAVKKLLLKEQEPLGGFLIAVREGKKKGGLADESGNKVHYYFKRKIGALMSKNEMEELLNRTVGYIKDYVREMRKGHFAAKPKDCVTYCDYKKICRYAHKPMD